MGFWHPLRRVPSVRATDIPTSTQPCTLHRDHRPNATYTELHHVIPQSWQQVWTPLRPGFPGKGTDGRTLWDRRTDPLCRTGHGNVHFWLVKLMREIAEMIPSGPITDQSVVATATVAMVKAIPAGAPRPNAADISVSRQAPIRFMQVGGDLRVLIEAGEWGEI